MGDRTKNVRRQKCRRDDGNEFRRAVGLADSVGMGELRSSGWTPSNTAGEQKRTPRRQLEGQMGRQASLPVPHGTRLDRSPCARPLYARRAKRADNLKCGVIGGLAAEDRAGKDGREVAVTGIVKASGVEEHSEAGRGVGVWVKVESEAVWVIERATDGCEMESIGTECCRDRVKPQSLKGR